MVRRDRKSHPIGRLVPSMITLIGLCAGMTAIRYALDQRYELAVGLIIFAGLMDIMDGRVARYFKLTSTFGAQLDSFADFINFGVSPALMLYLWCLKAIPIKGFGWGLALFFSICMVIRLARFNTHLNDKHSPLWQDHFFVGIPAPAGAFLALTPMMLYFNTEWAWLRDPFFTYPTILLVGLGMASRIPTFSTKKIVIKQEYLSITMAGIGLLFTGLLLEPWYIIPALSVLYVLSIPVSIMAYYRMKKGN